MWMTGGGMTGRKERKDLLAQHKEIKIFIERGQTK